MTDREQTTISAKKPRAKKTKSVKIEPFSSVDQPLIVDQALMVEPTLGDVGKKLFKPFTWFKNTLRTVLTKDPEKSYVENDQKQIKGAIKLVPVFTVLFFLVTLFPLIGSALIPLVILLLIPLISLYWLKRDLNTDFDGNGTMIFIGISVLMPFAIGLLLGQLTLKNIYSDVLLTTDSPVSLLTASELKNHNFDVLLTGLDQKITLTTDGMTHIKHEWTETKNQDGMRVRTEVPDTVVKWGFVGENLHVDGFPDVSIGKRNGNLYSGSGQVVGKITWVDEANQDTLKIFNSASALKIAKTIPQTRLGNLEGATNINDSLKEYLDRVEGAVPTSSNARVPLSNEAVKLMQGGSLEKNKVNPELATTEKSGALNVLTSTIWPPVSQMNKVSPQADKASQADKVNSQEKTLTTPQDPRFQESLKLLSMPKEK